VGDRVEQVFRFTDVFNELSPYFISIGMTYDQFWRDDVDIAKHYFKAYKIKLERDLDTMEWTVWKQGLYFYEALCYVSPILNAMAKKNTKPLPYPSAPHGKEEEVRKYQDKQSKKEPTDQEQENERLKAICFFNAWERATTKQFNKDKKK